MENQERLAWAERELERLKVVIFEQVEANAALRRENQMLKEQLAERPATEKEEKLFRIAKSIMDELADKVTR